MISPSDGMKSSELLVFLIVVGLVIGANYFGIPEERLSEIVNTALAYIVGRSGVKAAGALRNPDPHARGAASG